MLTQEHSLYKQLTCSARNKISSQMDAVGCKAIRHYHKIKHVFMFFPMKHHNHEVFNYFNSCAFALPLLRFTSWNTTESARRKKKNRDKYSLTNSLSSKFHKNLWNWLAMAMLSIIRKNIPWICQT